MFHLSSCARSLIHRSAMHAVVKAGFTPNAQGIIEPSMTYNPSYTSSESPTGNEKKIAQKEMTKVIASGRVVGRLDYKASNSVFNSQPRRSRDCNQ